MDIRLGFSLDAFTGQANNEELSLTVLLLLTTVFGVDQTHKEVVSMNRFAAIRFYSLIVAIAMGSVSIASAQDVPLPLLWKGEGMSLLSLPEQVESIPFKIELRVDEQGNVSGQVSIEDRQQGGVVEKLYYSDSSQGVRQLIVIIVAHDEENPNMFILRGKSIDDRLVFGEVLTKAFDKDGEIEQRLELNSKFAVQVYDSYMPTSLRNAINSCSLIGAYHIVGGYATP